MMRQLLPLFLLFFISGILSAQMQYTEADVANIILEVNPQKLTAEDVAGLHIDRIYYNKDTDATYIYARQTINDIPIHNAIASIAISGSGDFKSAHHRFVAGAQGLAQPATLSVDAEQAVRKAFEVGGDVPVDTELQPDMSRSEEDVTVYRAPELTDHGASTHLTYVIREGKFILSWEVSYFAVGGSDFWNVHIDAQSGDLVEKGTFTNHCSFDRKDHTHVEDLCRGSHGDQVGTGLEVSATDGAIYRALPLPIESPVHGDRALIVNPADSMASPYGWHDLNGEHGPETMITEGNNVNAWLDRNADDAPDRNVVGTEDLVFDFPYDSLGEPVDYEDAAVANMFYAVNMMHDFSYAYGLDEASGNFQVNNYTGQGQGGDPVHALSQFDGEAKNSINNATFSTPSDGNSGTLRMFLWDTRDDISVFNVDAPEEVAGAYTVGLADFGQEIDTVPVEGEVYFVDDDAGIPTDGCQDIVNGSDIDGNVAIIDRGDCEFGEKVLAAENEGAIAVIICNNVETGILQMAPGVVGNQVTIPSVFMSRPDCDKIRIHAGAGLAVRFQAPPPDDQPEFVDGDFDNGIIAHEYGHGISNRLTGGPDQSSCLNNTEQMGEGWSDFMTLVTTVQSGSEADDPRGIGNFAVRLDKDGRGIRAFPYSRDMSINPVTYSSIVTASIPHGLGHVWCSMLWDMYWNLVDRYGWDPDFIHGTGGNNKAIRLVFEGMKLQPCNPGFVDGRDAILEADQLLCDGENQDIIWQTFARRGVGLYADQGDTDVVGDETEDFTVPPEIIKTVKIEKVMPPTVFKDEKITVTLLVRNDMDTSATEIEMIDEIPVNAEVDESSLPDIASLDGDFVIIDLGDLAAGEKDTVTYDLIIPAVASELQLLDDLEDPNTSVDKWFLDPIAGGPAFNWVDDDAYSDVHSWKISNIQDESEQAVFSFFDYRVAGTNPVLRFAHKYDTEKGWDGCILEVSNDDLNSWLDLGKNSFRNGYNKIAQGAFTTTHPNAFTGNSGGWIHTYVDLADYLGDDVYLRWRFASDATETSDHYAFDDVTFFDAVAYNSEACLTYEDGDEPICDTGADWGTVVEPEMPSAVGDEDDVLTQVSVYPNPAGDIFTIELAGVYGQTGVTIRDMSGRKVYERDLDITQSRYQLPVRSATWSAGLYLIEIANDQGVYTEKFTKK